MAKITTKQTNRTKGEGGNKQAGKLPQENTKERKGQVKILNRETRGRREKGILTAAHG